MTPAAERYSRIQELFDAAVALPPAERAAVLQEQCGGDTALRQEVETLLAADAQTTSFGEQPAFEIPEDLFPEEDKEQLAGRRFGVYQVIREIGRGGLGAVYLAARADDEYRKEVAIKLIRRGLDTDDILRRFRTERQILAQLDHPNIARLLDGGTTDDGLPYFVMEYVKGEPINAYCEVHRLKLSERLELFRKVCAAVTYAHQNLVVHRDLKPSNILVTSDSESVRERVGEPKLLDFGIAKLLSADDEMLTQTAPGLHAMTPDYASPEQIKGEKITTASDVYSLGVLLYELLTGQRPYRLKTRAPEDIARAITEQIPDRPSTAAATDIHPPSSIFHPRSLQGDLDNIVLMALRKEPERRYSSVAQFSADIRRHLEGRPVIAHKDTLPYRAGKFVCRNRTGVTAAAIIGITLVLGLAVTLRQTQIARQERDNARTAETIAERARKQAEGLNGFLQRMLVSANPETTMGRDVKVVDVLAAAAKDLDRELAGEPDLLAQAHLTIARAYANLREGHLAEKHARAALEINLRIHGDDHPATAEVTAFLGWGLQIFHRFDEAEPLLRHALAVQRHQTPIKGEALAASLLSLSNLLIETGRVSEARPLVSEALDVSRQVSGPESVPVASGLNVLGNVSLAERDTATAMNLYRQSLEIYRKTTPLRIAYLNPLHNLATFAISQGRPEEAEPLLREAEEFCRENVGLNNITYGFVAGRLGLLDFLRGKYPVAAEKLQHCVAYAAPLYPKNDPDMVLTRALLGLALTRTGRPAEGEAFLREALTASTALPRDSLILSGMNFGSALGECLLAQGNYLEAEPLLRAGYDELKSRLGEENSSSVEAARLLATLEETRDTEQAAPNR